MSLDDLITERLRLFELVDFDASVLEVLCHRKETLDACKYYNPSPLDCQNGAFVGEGKLTILHHNVRSLLKKRRTIQRFSSQFTYQNILSFDYRNMVERGNSPSFPQWVHP